MAKLDRTFGCPVEFTLETLGGKWKSVILARLKQAPQRYGELRRAIPELSDKMLTERLRDLAAADLIVNREHAGGVTRYQLTPLGESLRPVLQALYEWGEDNAAALGARIRP